VLLYDAVVANEELTAFNTYDAVVALLANEAVIDKLPEIVFPSPSCNSLPLFCTRYWKDSEIKRLVKLRPIIY
jgi:hypothetical protein